MNFIIAGASKGTGRELAEIAAQKGHQVAAIGRSEKLLAPLKENKNTTTYTLDLTEAAHVDNAFKEIAGQWEGPTTLIHTAATWTGGKSVRELGVDDFKTAMNLNFYSALNPISSFLKFFKYSVDRPNTIIVFGATASLRGEKTVPLLLFPNVHFGTSAKAWQERRVEMVSMSLISSLMGLSIIKELEGSILGEKKKNI